MQNQPLVRALGQLDSMRVFHPRWVKRSALRARVWVVHPPWVVARGDEVT
jgi:hypothetical protein